MIRQLKKYSVLALTIAMLTGTIVTVSNKCHTIIPKKLVADITETIPETGSDEIVAGDEEVPL